MCLLPVILHPHCSQQLVALHLPVLSDEVCGSFQLVLMQPDVLIILIALECNMILILLVSDLVVLQYTLEILPCIQGKYMAYICRIWPNMGQIQAKYKPNTPNTEHG